MPPKGNRVRRNAPTLYNLFTTLPLEIREMIYAQFIPNQIRVAANHQLRRKNGTRTHEIRQGVNSVLSINRRMRAEAFAVMRRLKPVFIVNVEFVPKFIEVIGKQGRQAVINLELAWFAWRCVYDLEECGHTVECRGKHTLHALEALEKYIHPSPNRQSFKHLIISSAPPFFMFPTLPWNIRKYTPNHCVNDVHVRPLARLTGFEKVTFKWWKTPANVSADIIAVRTFTEDYYNKLMAKKTIKKTKRT
ncbi:hypothetical protein NA57DRAFT_75930 [Rhizodiscina lignyota]|uniref:2EXR domain-containing protein n=1 Tax=Rhizodiscina lignyota TaxID=1504668 RepID=A0A9P4IB81_9PEZI|nr:hypothetical protein NA57DRAFT_75930 [Rhizodiscina lignyota]